MNTRHGALRQSRESAAAPPAPSTAGSRQALARRDQRAGEASRRALARWSWDGLSAVVPGDK